jgi:hypothetical protein
MVLNDVWLNRGRASQNTEWIWLPNVSGASTSWFIFFLKKVRTKSQSYLFSTLSMACPQMSSDFSAFSTTSRHRPSSTVMPFANPDLIRDKPVWLTDPVGLTGPFGSASPLGVQDPTKAAAELRFAPSQSTRSTLFRKMCLIQWCTVVESHEGGGGP